MIQKILIMLNILTNMRKIRVPLFPISFEPMTDYLSQIKQKIERR